MSAESIALREVIAAANGLSRLLERVAQARPKQKPFWVAAYTTITAKGTLANEKDIWPGDQLYIAKVQQPGAGIISLDRSGLPFGLAAASIAAGMLSRIPVRMHQKRWILGPGGHSGNCDVCIGNADAGWIESGESFPSGDDEPNAHPSCTCDMEMMDDDENRVTV